MKTVKIFLGIPIYKDGEIIFPNSKVMKTVNIYSRIPNEIIFTNSKIYENHESIFIYLNDLNGLP